MTIETINTGAAPNDGTGDSLRDALIKVNSNFAKTPEQETGSWTPALAGSTTAGNHSYTLQQGQYVKLGKLVFLWGAIEINVWDTNADGDLRIKGLPFKSTVNLSGSANGDLVGSVNWVSGVASVPANFGGFVIVNFDVTPELMVRFSNLSTGGTSAADISVAGNGFQIRFGMVLQGVDTGS